MTIGQKIWKIGFFSKNSKLFLKILFLSTLGLQPSITHGDSQGCKEHHGPKKI